ncbi:UDP-glucuronosyltransferase 2B13-like isoform X1 [Drosophila serrata]|uniref:UDP-glucuronosyltransferase 2B13-like isoform X1 n=1 Tax=Drosophila serrata TaxID=7274 RepID=UPI000A1D0E47|nr:UDP-glucuronosyltransferase 2B13-like isoform X1 [Drosophila serrata]XP_020802467.1 UDP-glucuronosyltransferase 2B13-like isoform X1 [Drosophila serrata]XP_020802468.1 UDP-glucuronosyltransferase 2B13-like isoform X1 [Drosophila serrata]
MQFSLLCGLLLAGGFYSQLELAEGAKILAVYAFPGKSHFMMHTALMRELVESGHQVTMITAFSLAKEQLGGNYTEILIEPVYDFWHDVKLNFGAQHLFELTRMTNYDFLKMLEIIGLKTTEHALKQPKVQALIHAKETEGVFDLLLAEQFYQEAFLALAKIYKIPVVTTSTLGYENHMSQMMGLITPWSFVPHGFMPFTDRMSFLERVKNSYASLYEDLDRLLNYFPKMDAVAKEFFGSVLAEVPKVKDMERQISVMLLNSHAPLTTARPTVDAMVPVGGMHIYPPKALPQDMQDFLDGAGEAGAIYFSLGSNVQSKDMPPEMLRLFLRVFGSLRQRVLWKFEDESIGQLPANVMVRKWLPQADILAHRHVKVFITHGGLFGTQEGVHYAVPMLGIPFYCDQHLNMNKAVLGGYAISLHFQSITEMTLRQSLLQLIHNGTYKENIQRVSNIFKDRQQEPRRTAVYWIEYVIRYGGAPHMRSAGLDLNWFQFYLLDVIAFVVVVFIAGIMAIWLAIRLLMGSDKKHRKTKKIH